MKRTFSTLFLAALAVAASAADKLNVVATLPDLGSIAAEVGGPFISLTVLANPSEDPHFVDPRPSFAKVLNKADALLEGGADLEIGWLPPLIQNARNAKILPGQPGRIVASEGVAIKERPPGNVDRSQGDIHPNGNPHYLMDPANALVVARAFADRFGKLAPAHAEQFKQNADVFAKQAQATLDECEKLMAPYNGEKVVTYHKSFTYFLDRFGLAFFDTLEPKPGIEPSPSHITELIKTSKAAGVKFILIEDNRPRKTPDRVAQQIDAKVVSLRHMPETSGAAAYNTWIRGMVDACVKAHQTK